MCPRRPNADSGETCPRRPGCNRQQGETAPSRAMTYKPARLAYSRHDAKPAANGGPSKWSDVSDRRVPVIRQAAAFCTD